MRLAFRFFVLLLLVYPATAAVGEEPESHWAFRKPTRPEPPARDSLKHAARVCAERGAIATRSLVRTRVASKDW